MQDALGQNGRTLRGRNAPDCSRRRGKRDNREFYSRSMRKRSTRQIQNDAELTPKAIDNVRNARNGISGDTLLTWMENDHDFAAEVLEHIGFIRPGEGEFEGAFSKAVNAYVRKRANGDGQ